MLAAYVWQAFIVICWIFNYLKFRCEPVVLNVANNTRAYMRANVSR